MHECEKCGRSFGSSQALQQHLESPRHSLACDRCKRSFGSPEALEQHLSSESHLLRRSASKAPVGKHSEPQENRPKKTENARRGRRPDDTIDAFFAQYPRFPYNRDDFPRDEMLRMCRYFDWPSSKVCEEYPERDKAWGDFRVAVVQAFNSTFGNDVNDSGAWGAICELLGIIPIPESLESRRQAVVDTHVNLMDMFSQTRAGQKVYIFPTEEELRRYTIKTGHYFPKEEAYAGGLLKYLLREITGKYEGRRGNSNNARGKGKHPGKARRKTALQTKHDDI